MKKLLGLIFILNASVTGILIADDTCVEKCYKEAYTDCKSNSGNRIGYEQDCGHNYGECLRNTCKVDTIDPTSNREAQALHRLGVKKFNELKKTGLIDFN